MASREGLQSFFQSKPSQRYGIVSTSDAETDSELVLEKAPVDDTPRLRLSVIRILALICTVIGGSIIIFAFGYTAGYHDNSGPQPDGAFSASSNAVGACTSPYYRREWRSLSEEEKQSYLDAFQCFIDSPSVLGFNGSLYNDFAWAHNRVAQGSESEHLPCKYAQLT
jgi:hypothetical protein